MTLSALAILGGWSLKSAHAIAPTLQILHKPATWAALHQATILIWPGHE